MGNWFRRMMLGRYGVDQLTWALLFLSILFSICGNIFQLPFLRIFCWAALAYGYYRIFSRNIYARRLENEKFLGFFGRLKGNAASPRKRPTVAERRSYRYFTCPTCKQKLRVPRGKGKINITCPKCSTSFIRKS